MAGPHQPFGLPDSDPPHQKYIYVRMYVCMYVTLGYFHTDKSRIVLSNDGAVITTFSTQYRYIWTLIQVCFVDQQRADPLIS